MSLILFDFDNTLTTIDTTMPLVVFLANKRKMKRVFILMVFVIVLFKFRLISNRGMKKILIKWLIRGGDEEEILNFSQEFHRKYLEVIINKEVLDILLCHVSRSNEVYLVSANFDFFLQPLIKEWSIAGIIATQTEIKDHTFTGEIAGEICNRQEKLLRVISSFGEKAVKEATAYGDSNGDENLLSAVQNQYWIQSKMWTNPIQTLKQYWFILTENLLN